MGYLPNLLGVMELESNTYAWKDIWGLTVSWLQDAGGFAALGLLLWTIYVMFTPAPAVAGSRRVMISRFMAIMGIAALIVYLIAFGLTLASISEDQQRYEQLGLNKIKEQNPQAPIPILPITPIGVAREIALTVAGALALIGFCEPFFLDLFRLRGRRIYAIAKLSFKEAIRWRVFWVFLLALLTFLFPWNWFFFKGTKPEDVLKATISVNSYAMTILFVVTMTLLAGFSIPTDIKNLTIHTIVTKPVERFEIVAGRFLGYTALMTLTLFALTGASLIFILTSNINEAAKQESMKARVPVYGALDIVREKFENQRTQSQSFAGIDVGREYSYRKYIAGAEQSSHRAVWRFADAGDLRGLTGRNEVALEFAFDVYRMTKGEEDRGVLCSFDIITWKWDPANQDEYRREIRQELKKDQPSVSPDDDSVSAEQARLNWEAIGRIAKKYGRFEFRNRPVFDYHTYRLKIPPGLLENALEGAAPKDSPLQVDGRPVLLQVKVKCESPSQLIGVAPLDLYFLESDGLFAINFFKGAIGLWCRLCIVIALAVAASTYLAGVVSFLVAAVLFCTGYFQEFLKSLAEGSNVGGGPFESFTRLVKGSTIAADLDKTPTVQAAFLADDFFRWLLRRILNVVPDAERFTWSNYLAQGFSIQPSFILLNLLFLVAYLLPWAVLAYYLMRSREIAA